MNKIIIITLVFVITLISGCSINTSDLHNSSEMTATIEDDENTNKTGDLEQDFLKKFKDDENTNKTGDLEQDFLKKFMDAFPKAEIVSKAMFDLVNDNEKDNKKDLVIIFNNQIDPNDSSKISRSNIGVVTKTSIHVIDPAGGDLDYQFANGPDSMRLLEKPNRVSVILYNNKLNKTIDFHVTIDIDKEKNESTITIKSFELK